MLAGRPKKGCSAPRRRRVVACPRSPLLLADPAPPAATACPAAARCASAAAAAPLLPAAAQAHVGCRPAAADMAPPVGGSPKPGLGGRPGPHLGASNGLATHAGGGAQLDAAGGERGKKRAGVERTGRRRPCRLAHCASGSLPFLLGPRRGSASGRQVPHGDAPLHTGCWLRGLAGRRSWSVGMRRSAERRGNKGLPWCRQEASSSAAPHRSLPQHAVHRAAWRPPARAPARATVDPRPWAPAGPGGSGSGSACTPVGPSSAARRPPALRGRSLRSPLAACSPI